jgi:hypothetical protein
MVREGPAQPAPPLKESYPAEKVLSTPSPAVLTMRPPCFATSASEAALCPRRMLAVPTSSSPISRKYPATSAASIADNLRPTRLGCTSAMARKFPSHGPLYDRLIYTRKRSDAVTQARASAVIARLSGAQLGGYCQCPTSALINLENLPANDLPL